MSASLFTSNNLSIYQNDTEQVDILKISGSFYTAFADDIWKELRHFLESLERFEKRILRLVFEIEHINSVNVMGLCHVLNSSDALTDNKVQVNWACANDNVYMLELGQDISEVVNIPFQFT
jgi:hypothetical protein